MLSFFLSTYGVNEFCVKAEVLDTDISLDCCSPANTAAFSF